MIDTTYRVTPHMHFSFYSTMAMLTVLSLFYREAAAESYRRNHRDFLLLSFDNSINQRWGKYTFDVSKKSRAEKKPALYLHGVALGKESPITPWLSWQAGGVYHFGSTVEDTLVNLNGPLGLFCTKYHFTQAGVEGSLHFIRKLFNNPVFFKTGFGIHYMNMEEYTVGVQNPDVTVNVPFYTPLSINQISPEVHLGAGMNIIKNTKYGFGISYTFSVWNPIRFLDQRDLVLKPVKYSELFLSHLVSISLLLMFE